MIVVQLKRLQIKLILKDIDYQYHTFENYLPWQLGKSKTIFNCALPKNNMFSYGKKVFKLLKEKTGFKNTEKGLFFYIAIIYKDGKDIECYPKLMDKDELRKYFAIGNCAKKVYLLGTSDRELFPSMD